MEILKTLSGKDVPPVGLGTFPLQGEELANVFIQAVKLGYRLIDTADDYRGESGIGLALKRGVSRDDVFIQSKISENNAYADEPLSGKFFNRNSRFMNRHTVEEVVREKVRRSLLDLGTDYIDSLLIHYPYPDYYEEIWQTLIRLKKENLVRYIGVSNFHPRHIDILTKYGEKPSINEIYISPIGTKEDQVSYANENGITLMSYSPLMDLVKKQIPLPVIEKIADKYGKTPSQIVLRWNIERGCIPLPKSKNIKRLKENFDIFDFSLNREEVQAISSLNENHQFLVESKICPGI